MDKGGSIGMIVIGAILTIIGLFLYIIMGIPDNIYDKALFGTIGVGVLLIIVGIRSLIRAS